MYLSNRVLAAVSAIEVSSDALPDMAPEIDNSTEVREQARSLRINDDCGDVSGIA